MSAKIKYGAPSRRRHFYPSDIWATTWQNQQINVRPAKTQISLGNWPVWSEYSLCAQWVAEDPRLLHAHSEDSDQTGWCPGWSESSLGANSFCWFCYVAAHILMAMEEEEKSPSALFAIRFERMAFFTNSNGSKWNVMGSQTMVVINARERKRILHCPLSNRHAYMYVRGYCF